MKKNKFIYKIVFGIMLAIGLFFNSDKVLAKTCEYSHDEKVIIATETGAADEYTITTAFSITFDDTSGNIIYDSNYKVGSADKDIYMPSLADNRYLEELKQNQKLSFFNDSYLQISLGTNGECPDIYLTKEHDKYYILPSDVDANGGGPGSLWSKINNSTANSYIYFDPGSQKVCDDKVLDEIIKEKNKLVKKYFDDPYNSKLYSMNYASDLWDKMNYLDNSVCDEFYNNFGINNKFDFNHAEYQTVSVEMAERIRNKYGCVFDNPQKVFDELNKKELENGNKMNIYGGTDYYTNRLNSLISHADLLLRKCRLKAGLSEKDANNEYNENQNELKDFTEEINEKSEEYYIEYQESIFKISGIELGEDIEYSCEGLLGQDLIDLISQLYGYIKVVTPILLLIFGTIDFGSAIISQDKEALEKAFKKFIKRAIVCVVIFFVPLIIKWLLSNAKLPDGTPIIEDPLCGIEK